MDDPNTPYSNVSAGFDEDDIPDDALEFLEAEAAGACSSPGKQASSTTSYVPEGSIPSMNGRLTAAAAEFWFPTSRECRCCNGYRHACDCVKSRGFLACQQTDPACCPPEYLGVKATPKASTTAPSLTPPSANINQNLGGNASPGKAGNWYSASRNCECCQGRKFGCACVTSSRFVACQKPGCVDPENEGKQHQPGAMVIQPPSPASGGSSGGYNSGRGGWGNSPRGQPCKFDSMPGGCRFGSNCRFVHASTNSPASGGHFGQQQRAQQQGQYSRGGHFGQGYGQGQQQHQGYSQQGYGYGSQQQSGGYYNQQQQGYDSYSKY